MATNSISIEVDITGIISEMSDRDLVAEVKARQIDVNGSALPIPVHATARNGQQDYFDGWAEELRLAAHCSDWRHFDIVLNRMRPVPATVSA